LTVYLKKDRFPILKDIDFIRFCFVISQIKHNTVTNLNENLKMKEKMKKRFHPQFEHGITRLPAQSLFHCASET